MTTRGAPDIFLVALATLSLLSERATREPLLLVADDAQWLDQATFEVLAFVSRRLSSDPIVLVVAMRDDFKSSLGDASALRLRLSGLDAGRRRALAGRQRAGPSGGAAQPLPSRRPRAIRWPLWSCPAENEPLEMRRGFR